MPAKTLSNDELSGPGFYDEPTIAWSLRTVGPHLHPGGEEATILLAQRAASHGFPTSARILDLGSGLGAPSRFLARRFRATVVGVDIEGASQRTARLAAISEGLRDSCPLLCAAAQALPFAPMAFDAAWSQDALGHMDKEAAVRELVRVLRPDAILAFTDWVARDRLTREELGDLKRSWHIPSLLRPAEYVALLEANGFELLLAEDITYLRAGRGGGAPSDQGTWEAGFAHRYGGDELVRQGARTATWVELLRAGRTGYGMFVARRRTEPGQL